MENKKQFMYINKNNFTEKVLGFLVQRENTKI